MLPQSKHQKGPIRLTWWQTQNAFREAKPGWLVIAVEWDDACRHTRDGLPETLLVHSIGFLTDISPKTLSVTMDLLECGGVRDTTTIPLSLVRSIYFCSRFSPMPHRPHADS